MTERFKKIHQFSMQWESGFGRKENNDRFAASRSWLMLLEDELEKENKKLTNTCDGSNVWDFTSQNEGDLKIAKEMKAYTQEELAKLLYKKIWIFLHCHNLPKPLAFVLYDSVLCLGKENAIKILQEICNIVGEAHLDIFNPIIVDGICGPKTITLCTELSEFNLDYYTARMVVRSRINFQTNLARTNKILNSHLPESKKRCQELLELLALMERGA